MFGLFKSKPILSQDDTEFQIATYKWLLKHFGGADFYEDSKLILPTREYFPAKVSNENDVATETFNAVKKYAGIEDWPCRLVAQEEDIDVHIAPTIAIKNAPNNPHGTFQATENGEIVITYNPALVHNPTQLVATYAHELAHYLTGTCTEEPPGGWENWEFATDITATFLGFGIFMANSAFNFQQFSGSDAQGWQYNRSGYLSESEHVFALAIFISVKQIPVKTVLPHLKSNLASLLKRALKHLADSDLISELKAVQFQDTDK
jgi:hypothetical protein